MLTYQTVRNKFFPLGFKARRGNGWNEEVFAKLPWEMQEILSEVKVSTRTRAISVMRYFQKLPSVCNHLNSTNQNIFKYVE